MEYYGFGYNGSSVLSGNVTAPGYPLFTFNGTGQCQYFFYHPSMNFLPNFHNSHHFASHMNMFQNNGSSEFVDSKEEVFSRKETNNKDDDIFLLSPNLGDQKIYTKDKYMLPHRVLLPFQSSLEPASPLIDNKTIKFGLRLGTTSDGYQEMLYYELNDDGTRCCPCCKKSYKSDYTLRGHFIRVHMAKKKYFCSWLNCGRGFWSNSDLERHMPSHTGQRFICDTCNRSYKSKQRLTEHLRNPSSCWLEPTMLEFMEKILYQS